MNSAPTPPANNSDWREFKPLADLFFENSAALARTGEQLAADRIKELEARVAELEERLASVD